MTNIKTTLAGAIPAIATLIFAAFGFAIGRLDADSAIGLATLALGQLGVGWFAKDAEGTKGTRETNVAPDLKKS